MGSTCITVPILTSSIHSVTLEIPNNDRFPFSPNPTPNASFPILCNYLRICVSLFSGFFFQKYKLYLIEFNVEFNDN